MGVGPLLSEEEVRAMMLLRANVTSQRLLRRARSTLVELLAGNVERRTVSSRSGAGKCRRERRSRAAGASRALDDRRRNTACRDGSSGRRPTMLRANGLEPVKLGPKEGHHADQRHAGAHGDGARCSCTMRMTSLASGACRAAHVARSAHGTPVAFDARIQDARGPGRPERVGGADA